MTKPHGHRTNNAQKSVSVNPGRTGESNCRSLIKADPRGPPRGIGRTGNASLTSVGMMSRGEQTITKMSPSSAYDLLSCLGRVFAAVSIADAPSDMCRTIGSSGIVSSGSFERQSAVTRTTRDDRTYSENDTSLPGPPSLSRFVPKGL
jgi:hypothetical protein